MHLGLKDFSVGDGCAGAVDAVLEQLKHHLREDDPSAQTVWEENAALLGSRLTQAQAVQAAIESFDYELALDLLS